MQLGDAFQARLPMAVAIRPAEEPSAPPLPNIVPAAGQPLAPPPPLPRALAVPRPLPTLRLPARSVQAVPVQLREFRWEEISRIVHRDNMVGRGGSGAVYGGFLSDGTAVAIKKQVNCGLSSCQVQYKELVGFHANCLDKRCGLIWPCCIVLYNTCHLSRVIILWPERLPF